MSTGHAPHERSNLIGGTQGYRAAAPEPPNKAPVANGALAEGGRGDFVLGAKGLDLGQENGVTATHDSRVVGFFPPCKMIHHHREKDGFPRKWGMWRDNLKRIVDERADGNMKRVSLKAGLGPTAVRDILIGRSKAPTIDTLEKIAEALGISLSLVFDGLDDPREVATVPVMGDVAAGLFFDLEPFDHIPSQPSVPAAPGRYHGLPQKAWRVRGPSMNKLHIDDGDFVISVDFDSVRSTFQDGDVIVVEVGRDDGLRERTLKQVEIGPEFIELCPRSTDPKFQTPLRIPRGASSNGQITIIGLVVGVFRPIGAGK